MNNQILHLREDWIVEGVGWPLPLRRRWFAFILPLFMAGCAPTPDADTKLAMSVTPIPAVAALPEIPDWYAMPPTDDANLYGRGAATSSDLQFSLDKAILVAKRDVAARIGSKFSALMKNYMRETGGSAGDIKTAEESERVIKDIVSEITMVGYSTTKTKISVAGNGYVTFVLVKYPVVDANRVVADKIIHDSDFGSELDSKLRSSKAFKELEDEIAKSGPPALTDPVDNPDEPPPVPAVPTPKIKATRL